MTLRRRLLDQVFPLATSLALHAGVIAVGWATYQAVKPHMFKTELQPFVPTVDAGFDNWRRLPRPTPHELPVPEWEMRPNDESSLSKGIAKGQLTLESVRSADAVERRGETSLIIGPAAVGFAHRGNGADNGDFANPAIGSAQGKNAAGTFFPPITGTPAKSVAFVCDASGSMMSTFRPLKHEIQRYVDALRATQSFNVIFFQESSAAAVDAHGLLMAGPDAKRRAYTFLDGIAPRGQTNPIPALELAFKQRPALIYLLTDGDFPDNAVVLQLIREKNSDHRTKINTIAFVARGDEYEKVLKTIARENDGVFRYVGEDELK